MANHPPQSQGQCFSVCLAEADANKKFAVLKFPPSNKVDFTLCTAGAKLERENNLKEFKSAYDIDVLPKFGAGSEYGKEQREEARKKMYGIKIKKYDPQDQPWLLKLGSGKQIKRFRGTRNGGVTKNASYYIFMPMSDSKFIAQPVEEWYDFIPQAKYKALNAEEAEEEFSRRDRTLNHFAIMMKKRIDKHENDGNIEEGAGGKKSKKKDKSFLVSEFDEMSNEDDDLDSECEVDKDENANEGKPKKRGNKMKRSNLVKKRKGTDDEAEEESDEMDEGQEVDYMSGSSSDDEGMYDDGKRDEGDTYKDASVVEEEALRKLVNSDDDEDDEENKKDDDNEDDDIMENDKTKDGKAGRESDAESSSSSSDIDEENDQLHISGKSASAVKQTESDVSTVDLTNKKRKMDPLATSLLAKKVKLDSSLSQRTTQSFSSNSDASMEETLKRYLLRKPITPRDLLQKLHSKHNKINRLSKNQLEACLADILKKLNPEVNKIDGKMYLSLKPALTVSNNTEI
ncbi:hypothetical protein HELRODRAFT_184964 [Helobdella robusta]|uniref:Transcription initiation factor IIF subunit alpha n=1 Tax=Helobdella robusta TaxID=6412 RepID=T1FM77_HELRO|nr:hypothetical protein HELRODRAFT_184964 [Helobdella robusta]ESO02021.1 hypothetical protein HELRODRAFT_184964 [Helobdella robusta]